MKDKLQQIVEIIAFALMIAIIKPIVWLINRTSQK